MCPLAQKLENGLIFNFSCWCVFGCLHLIYRYIGFKFFQRFYIIYFIVESCGKLWKRNLLVFKWLYISFHTFPHFSTICAFFVVFAYLDLF